MSAAPVTGNTSVLHGITSCSERVFSLNTTFLKLLLPLTKREGPASRDPWHKRTEPDRTKRLRGEGGADVRKVEAVQTHSASVPQTVCIKRGWLARGVRVTRVSRRPESRFRRGRVRVSPAASRCWRPCQVSLKRSDKGSRKPLGSARRASGAPRSPGGSRRLIGTHVGLRGVSAPPFPPSAEDKGR
ncbi:hypothetical protein GN956_G11183 [Arapaima gigas]